MGPQLVWLCPLRSGSKGVVCKLGVQHSPPHLRTAHALAQDTLRLFEGCLTIAYRKVLEASCKSSMLCLGLS